MLQPLRERLDLGALELLKVGRERGVEVEVREQRALVRATAIFSIDDERLHLQAVQRQPPRELSPVENRERPVLFF